MRNKERNKIVSRYSLEESVDCLKSQSLVANNLLTWFFYINLLHLISLCYSLATTHMILTVSLTWNKVITIMLMASQSYNMSHNSTIKVDLIISGVSGS